MSDLEASLPQSDADALVRRTRAERAVSRVAGEFVAGHPAERIRVLPDARFAGRSGADFLLQIDDYDVRLVLLDAPDDRPALDLDALHRAIELLEDNPSTVAAIVVWTTGDLLAVPLSVRRARRAVESSAGRETLARAARPLAGVLREIVAAQTNVWDAELELAPCAGAPQLDTRRVFEMAIRDAIRAERGRTYRTAGRKEAAMSFPVDDEIEIILGALDSALRGETAKELEAQLLRVQGRGQ